MSKIKSATFPVAQTSGVSPAGHVLAEKPPRRGLCWGQPDTCTPGQGPHSGQQLNSLVPAKAPFPNQVPSQVPGTTWRNCIHVVLI